VTGHWSVAVLRKKQGAGRMVFSIQYSVFREMVDSRCKSVDLRADHQVLKRLRWFPHSDSLILASDS
jgi:hypothetical protein